MNKNVPNILTIMRVVLVPIFCWAYMSGHALWALIIFIVASLTDMLDGKIARKYNLVSNFGKFMDPLADKILTCAAFCLFVYDRIMPAYFLIIILAREFAVAGIRMLAAEKGTVIAADIFGKIKTVLQMIAIPLILLYEYLVYLDMGLWRAVFTAGEITMSLSVLMTVVSGANYIIKNISVLKD